MISLFAFFFGLCAGSFLDAVVDRMAEGKSVLKGRSYCPFCKHQLAWFDLIPLLSFLMLGGKCRYCKKPISWQYPLVEIFTAGIFLLIFDSQFSLLYQNFGGQVIFNQFLNLAYLWAVASLLIVIFVYDLKYFLIPDGIIYSAIGITLLYKVSEFMLPGRLSLPGNLVDLVYQILSAIFAGLFFLVIYLISKGKWMGFGDVKLAFFMGLFLGFPGIVVALFLAFFVGALVGITLIAIKKKQMRSEVPFGPFLIGGTFVALLWGQAIFDWYLKFLLV